MHVQVSTRPALAFNTPEDAARRAHGAVLAFVGRVPVHVVGDAPNDSYLVPSGKDDGSARAVPWVDLLRRYCSRGPLNSCFSSCHVFNAF